jgi:hypothetical protein
MNTAPINKGLVLAIHPTARGFGWVLFESPLAPVDWGIAFAKRGRNERLFKRFERLLSRYEPSVLVLEEFERGTTLRAGITERLCQTMMHLARLRGMEVHAFRRSAIRAVFATVGARTRYEIAEIVRQQIDAFSHRMPRRRTLLTRPDPKQSLFDAAAVAVTYFAALDGSA